MSQFVKILLNGKVSSVYAEEAIILIEKGLAQPYQESSEKQKSIDSDYENKMIKKAPKNKKNAKS
jgi:hypothetical protein